MNCEEFEDEKEQINTTPKPNKQQHSQNKSRPEKNQEESRVVIKIEESFVEVSDKSVLTIYERHMN